MSAFDWPAWIDPHAPWDGPVGNGRRWTDHPTPGSIPRWVQAAEDRRFYAPIHDPPGRVSRIFVASDHGAEEWMPTSSVVLDRYARDAEYAATWALGAVRRLVDVQVPGRAFYSAAGDALKDERWPSPQQGEDIQSALATRVWRASQALTQAWLTHIGDRPVAEVATERIGKILWADHLFIEWLRKRGQSAGAAGGGVFALQAADRWQTVAERAVAEGLFGDLPGEVWNGIYRPSGGPPPGDGRAVYRWLEWVAEVVWRDEHKPVVEHELYLQEQIKHPMLPTFVTQNTNVLGDHSYQLLNGKKLEGRGTYGWLIPAEVADLIAHTAALSSIHAQGFFRSAATIALHARLANMAPVALYRDPETGHQLIARSGSERVTHVYIEGGYSTLAKYLEGANNLPMDRKSVSKAMLAIWRTAIAWHDGQTHTHTHLVTDMRHNTAGGDQNLLRFTLCRLFHPVEMAELAKRQTVLMIGLSQDCPPFTSDRTAGATSKLEIAALTHMREHIRQWTEEGMQVPWYELARHVQLSEDKRKSRVLNLLGATLQGWLDAGRWERTGGGAVWEGYWRPTAREQLEPLQDGFHKTTADSKRGRAIRARRKHR